MSNISKRRKEGARAKIKSMGDHKEFLKRITKTLYYGQLPSLPCLSLPVTEISCATWSAAQRGRSLRRLHVDAAAGVARSACVSPCALVLALLYLERLRARNPHYLSATSPADLFLVSLMVGNKFLQDDGEDDEVICSEWATSGGLELGQLKKLEVEFLDAIEWNVFVSDKCFETGLCWLERQVALKQAQLHGFFTYSDLSAAGDAALAGELARAVLAAALRCGAALLALAGAALLLAPPAPGRPASPSAWSTDTDIMRMFPDDFAPPARASNATFPIDFSVDAPADGPAEADKMRCCSKWLHHQARTSERSWYDGVLAYDWKSLEPWWSRTSVLNWLYQRSLINPMQRWLERIDEYADLFRQELSAEPPKRIEKCHEYARHTDQQRCVRQWLNLSKLGALVVSVSDR